MTNSLVVFENYKIRRIYDEKNERWYFSIIDIGLRLYDRNSYHTSTDSTG